jgi:aspartyl-tRNA(Asn)/glutamyl-tRNA(Gln) amidotransferase subunit B
MPYEAVIGLEVHAQLKTQTKIFCGCSAAFGAPPNTHVCPVCLGMPGALPVLNRKVVDFALRMALATGCRIARTSRFARKNYFYPDLPKGYQISQYELPIAEHGAVDIAVDGKSRRIGITRIHMEEDAGKLSHDPDRPVSRVDLNPAGVPLIEIVSEPDLRTPEEAGAYLRKLRTILRYLDISDGNMEEGSFRCDANVSLRPRGQAALGTRTELKNINSFRFVEKALHYEIQRQREILEDGGRVVQETRLWHDAQNRTYAMRGKEEAHDYRYFPDPDLLPLVIDEAWIETLRQSLPELPAARRRRYAADFGLPDYDAEVITGARELADYFEACVAAGAAAKPAANWIMGSLLGLLKAENRDFDQIPVPAPALAELLRLIDDGTISGKIAKTVFDEMADSGRTAAAIVAEKGLVQISDAGEIGAVVDRILAANAGQVAAYRSGKTKIFGFFVGQVMKETRGKANPQVVNDLLRQKLDAG